MIFQIDFKFEGLCAATFAPMKENGYVLCSIIYSDLPNNSPGSKSYYFLGKKHLHNLHIY